MASATVKQETDAVHEHPGYQLDVSSYDRAASMLISLLVLVGILVVGLVIVYFANKVFFTYEPSEILPAKIEGRGDNPMGFERDIEPPAAEEIPDLQEPEIIDMLTEVSQVSSKLTRLTDAALDSALQGQGRGDSRPAGPQREGISERVPRHERWKINYTNEGDLDAYARQLDFFGIELAAYDPVTRTVDYAKNLAQASPETVKSRPEHEDTRLFMEFRSGTMSGLDRQLMQKAGLNISGKRLVQFYPERLEGILEELERQEMIKKKGKYDVNQIRRTTFIVLQQGTSYEFKVLTLVPF